MFHIAVSKICRWSQSNQKHNKHEHKLQLQLAGLGKQFLFKVFGREQIVFYLIFYIFLFWPDWSHVLSDSQSSMKHAFMQIFWGHFTFMELYDCHRKVLPYISHAAPKGMIFELFWSENRCKKRHFWSEIGSGFKEPGGTTLSRIPRSTPQDGCEEIPWTWMTLSTLPMIWKIQGRRGLNF